MTESLCRADGRLVAQGDRVLIVAAAGTGNVGDEAMLAGLLTRLGRRRDVTVVSANPDATTAMHRVDAVRPTEAVGALLRSDAVIIGGGSLFTDAMGWRGRLIPLFGRLALAARKRVSLVGVSIDATTPRPLRPLVTGLVQRAHDVRVRDMSSAEMLAFWGVEAVVEPDLSAWVSPASQERASALLEDVGIPAGERVVALCLNGVNPTLAESVRSAIPEVVRRLPGVRFCLVPMSHHPTARHEDDVFFARQLQAAVPGLPMLSPGLHPSEVLGVLAACDAAVCMRYHSLLFAHRSGIAVLGIPYAEKCRVWLAEQGLSPCPADADAIIARLEAALAERGSTRNPTTQGAVAL